LSNLLIAALVAIAIVLAGLCGCADASGLAVHCSGTEVVSATVTSPNLERPISLLGKAQRMPLEHGPYKVRIVYADRLEVWLEFFHADAGKRRTVDVYVTRDDGSDTVDVSETANSGGALETLFTGRTRLQDMSEQKPYLLDWL